MDEILDSLEDAGQSLSFKGEKDKDKQKVIREAAIAKDGALYYWLVKFSNRLEENEKRGHKNGFVVGDALTVADLALSGSLATFVSGYFDHIPKDYYTKNFPKLETYIATVNKNEKMTDFNNKYTERLKDWKDDTKKASVKCVTYAGKKADNIGQ